MLSISETFATWARNKSWDSVSAPHRTVAVESFLDTIGVAVAGSREPVSRTVRDYVEATAAPGPCEVWGTSVRLPAGAAAFANGTAAMSQEFDDRHTCTGHPSCVLVPALVAAAQSERVSGRSMLEGYVVGLGLFAAVADLFQDNLPTRGWHATSVLGAIGGAAGVAKALGLSREQIGTSIGVAVSMAAGSSANFGSPTKAVHAGWAARSAVEAAVLTRAGLTASADALYGELGGTVAFGHVPSPSVVENASDLERLVRVADDALAGLVRKQFPCLGATHLAAEAALEVHRRLPPGAEVKNARLKLSRGSQTMSYREDPVDASQARHSFRYVVSLILARGEPVPRFFDDEELFEPRTREIMRLLEIEEETTGPYGAGNARSTVQFADLSVDLGDGTTVQSLRTNPPYTVTGAALDAKFLACVHDTLDEPTAVDVCARLRALDTSDQLQPLVTLAQ